MKWVAVQVLAHFSPTLTESALSLQLCEWCDDGVGVGIGDGAGAHHNTILYDGIGVAKTPVFIGLYRAT